MIDNKIITENDEVIFDLAKNGDIVNAKTIDGSDFTEVFTIESFAKIIENFKKDNKEIRIDIDHKSLENETIAYGWIFDLIIEDDFLRAKAKFLENGCKILNEKEYRYCSPVFYFCEDNTPYFLESVALTNTPRLKNLRKVLNSEDFQEKSINNYQKEEYKDMIKENIIKIFGLSDDISDEDVIKVITELKQKAEEKIIEEVEEKKEIEKEEEKSIAENDCEKEEEKIVENRIDLTQKEGIIIKNEEEIYQNLKGGFERWAFLMNKKDFLNKK